MSTLRHSAILIQIFIMISSSFSLYYKYPTNVSLKHDGINNDAYIANIDVLGVTRELRLTPVENIWSKDALSVHFEYKQSGEKIFKIRKIPQDIKVFQDTDKKAILSITNRKVNGILDSKYMIKSGEKQHYIYEPVKREQDNLDIVIAVRYLLDKSVNISQPNISFLHANKYTPEITVIVDSTLANKIGNNFQVLEYLTVFWNAVKKRFQTISNLSIEIKLVGAVIMRNISDEPFIRLYNNESIYMKETFLEVSRWATNNATIPDHDILYFQTGRESKDVGGISYQGGACTKTSKIGRTHSIAAGEDREAIYRGTLIATHQIVHNLGAPHDSTTACKNAGFLMGFGNPENLMLFSNCSIARMAKYMASKNGTCLAQTLTQTKLLGVYKLQKPLWEIPSMDQQCKIITGDENSVVDAKTNPEDNLCYRLRCITAINNRSVSIGLKDPPEEGSKCPSGNRCSKGKCVN